MEVMVMAVIWILTQDYNGGHGPVIRTGLDQTGRLLHSCFEGPAPVDFLCTRDVDLMCPLVGAVSRQPCSSFTVFTPPEEGCLFLYFPNFMSSYNCRKEKEKLLRTQILEDTII